MSAGEARSDRMLARLQMLLRSIAPVWLREAVRLVRSGALVATDARLSYSQEGEDLLLDRLFGAQSAGFFVDVGAHHPTRFSNTYLLYRRGWRGLNIDPTPGSMEEFERVRPRDINLEVAVSSVEGERSFHLFDEPALNSLDEGLSRERARSSNYSLRKTITVAAIPLRQILETHLPHSVDGIDLMSIDVEGHDMDVLRSNDWERFRPRILLIEMLDSSLDDIDQREEVVFLRGCGYRIYAKLVNTVVLRDVRVWG